MTQKTPYIGSTISLISKLNIRYEGILFTVNSAESTIALAQVRSFGTENRPTSRPVPVRNDVYEYIIFKASDIKDLVVCDTPKDNNPEAQVNSQPTELSLPNNSANSPQQVDKNVNGFSNDTKPNSRQFRTNNPNRHFNNYNTMFYQRNNNNSGIPSFRHNQKDRLKFDCDYDFEKANEQFQHTLNSLGLDIEKIKFENNKCINKKSDEITSIDQKTNVELEKELKKENLIVHEIKTDNVVKEKSGNKKEKKNLESFYDKKCSFFDCISCETQEKEEGKNIRPDWKKERQTNQETFGHSAVRSLAFRRNRGPPTSGFKYNNNSGKNHQFAYRSGPLSNYQVNGNYSNYNNHVNNYNQQNNRRYTAQRFASNGGLDVDGYRRRTVGARLRAF